MVKYSRTKTRYLKWIELWLYPVECCPVTSRMSEGWRQEATHRRGASVRGCYPSLTTCLPLKREATLTLYCKTNRGEVTRDTWHVTPDMWHVVGVNILSKFQLSSSYGLGVMMFWRSGGKESVNESINQSVTEVFVEQLWLHRVC